MYPENTEGTRVILGSMNMGYVRNCQGWNLQPVSSQVLDDKNSIWPLKFNMAVKIQ